MLVAIPVPSLKRQLSELFMKDVNASEDLFLIDSIHILNADVPYLKTKDDPKDYSGYDFSKYKDAIPGKYILAMTIEEWGYVAAMQRWNDGPFMSFAIRLIDKDTNQSVWEYKKTAFQIIESALMEINHVSIMEKDIEEAYRHEIDKTLKDIFNSLNGN